MKDFIARFKKAWGAFVRTWKFEKDVGSTTERVRKEVEYDLRAQGYHPRNASTYFNCPVCDKVSFPKKVDMHKVAIMDDGTEINY